MIDLFLFQAGRLPAELLASATSRDLLRGEYLCHQGDEVRAVFTVVVGRVQLCTYIGDGRQVPIYTVRAGECVAEAALFADTYCSDVVAETKTRVNAFPINTLRETLRNRPELAEEFMTLQAKRCGILRTSLELRSLRSARERICRFLTISSTLQMGSVTLDRPLKNIADDLGLSHESFYRNLNNLIFEGTVTRTGKVLQLHHRCENTSKHQFSNVSTSA